MRASIVAMHAAHARGDDRRAEPERGSRAAASWPALLFGAFVGASLLLELLAPARPRLSMAAQAFVEARSAGERALEHDCVRELERLPGVGEVRALAIAHARWQARVEQTPFVLEDVPGIGPGIAAGVRAEYARRARSASAER